MKKIMSFAFAAALVAGFSGCDSSSSSGSLSDVNVTFSDLNNTGEMGYLINVDLDFNDDTYDGAGVDYYFCTDAVSSYDYYAYALEGYEPLVNEPDYDYGGLFYAAGSGTLHFISNSHSGVAYDVNSSSNGFTTGQTYSIAITLYGNPETSGTVHINSISDFNCTEAASAAPLAASTAAAY